MHTESHIQRIGASKSLTTLFALIFHKANHTVEPSNSYDSLKVLATSNTIHNVFI